MSDINCYTIEKSCIYKNEEYLVRDNGSVFRKCRPQNKARKLDNKWTFGTINKQNGYLLFGSERVHRIVATAFHGDPPTKDHVVDHIDANRQNNRPENLRWVTKFENTVSNPITRKKIEYITGVDIIEFLKNPHLYRNKFKGTNLNWMRNVTEEEALNCLIRFNNWTKSNSTNHTGKKLDEWVFSDVKPIEKYYHLTENNINNSLTFNAKQKNWTTPTKFVCCPEKVSENPVDDYMKNICIGSIFSLNKYGESIVVKCAVVDNCKIIVLTELPSTIKSFALSEITYENDYFIHESVRSFFTIEGAEKHFTLAQGLEWAGEDSIDDYC